MPHQDSADPPERAVTRDRTHGHEPPGLVVPHEDDDLVLGDRLLVVGGQHGLRPLAQVGLELLVGIRIDLPAPGGRTPSRAVCPRRACRASRMLRTTVPGRPRPDRRWGSSSALALAIAGSSRSPQRQAVASPSSIIPSDSPRLFLRPCRRIPSALPASGTRHRRGAGPARRRRHAGDRPGDGTGGRPSPVMPERRDEDAAARPEGCGPEGHQPPPSLR